MNVIYYMELYQKTKESENLHIFLKKEDDIPFLPTVGLCFQFGDLALVAVNSLHWNNKTKKLCVFFENMLDQYNIFSKQDFDDIVSDLRNDGFS